jgi:hypothetical protein
MPFVKGCIDRASDVVSLYIQPNVAHLATHIVDRNGVPRETLVAGQSYEAFEHSKPYLKHRVILLEIKLVPSRCEPSLLDYSAK